MAPPDLQLGRETERQRLHQGTGVWGARFIAKLHPSLPARFCSRAVATLRLPSRPDRRGYERTAARHCLPARLRSEDVQGPQRGSRVRRIPSFRGDMPTGLGWSRPLGRTMPPGQCACSRWTSPRVEGPPPLGPKVLPALNTEPLRHYLCRGGVLPLALASPRGAGPGPMGER
jgi:hypothetical protein